MRIEGGKLTAQSVSGSCVILGLMVGGTEQGRQSLVINLSVY